MDREYKGRVESWRNDLHDDFLPAVDYLISDGAPPHIAVAGTHYTAHLLNKGEHEKYIPQDGFADYYNTTAQSLRKYYRRLFRAIDQGWVDEGSLLIDDYWEWEFLGEPEEVYSRAELQDKVRELYGIDEPYGPHGGGSSLTKQSILEITGSEDMVSAINTLDGWLSPSSWTLGVNINKQGLMELYNRN